MPTIKELDALNGEMTEWRHALHQKPEMAFEEEWTSDFIAEKLESFGIEIHRGLAKTGIVGVVRGKLPGQPRHRLASRYGRVADRGSQYLHSSLTTPGNHARLRSRRALGHAARRGQAPGGKP